MKKFAQFFKQHQYTMVIPVSLMLVDSVLIYLCFQFVAHFKLLSSTQGSSLWVLSSIYIVCWLFSNLVNLVYFIENLSSYKKILQIFLGAVVLYGVMLFFMLAPGLYQGFLLKSLLALYVTTSALVLSARLISYKFYRVFQSIPSNRKNTIIVGYNSKAKKLFHCFNKHPEPSNRIVGIFDEIPPNDIDIMNLFYLGKLDQVKEFCLKNKVQEIYVALNYDTNAAFIEDLTKFVDKHFIYLGFISNADTIDPDYTVEAKIFDNGRIPVISYRRIPLRFVGNLMVKRVFDIVFSSIVLLILGTTLFPVIALAIKLTSKGPVFYIQKRPGYNNNFFDCYKFRTMVVNQEGDKQTLKNDKRITRIGAFLRKTSLDELPQFFNVFKGDMSVVGPRPNLIAQLDYYGRMIEDYSLRHSVVPGITGYAQINGYRGATEQLEDMERRVEHDIWYLQNWKLRVDLQIIANTVINIIKGEEKAY